VRKPFCKRAKKRTDEISFIEIDPFEKQPPFGRTAQSKAQPLVVHHRCGSLGLVSERGMGKPKLLSQSLFLTDPF
jgi:hypothetical protein